MILEFPGLTDSVNHCTYSEVPFTDSQVECTHDSLYTF